MYGTKVRAVERGTGSPEAATSANQSKTYDTYTFQATKNTPSVDDPYN